MKRILLVNGTSRSLNRVPSLIIRYHRQKLIRDLCTGYLMSDDLMMMMYDAGIKIVDDIVDYNGNLMRASEIKRTHPDVTSNILTIQSVTSALPVEWKRIIRRHDNERLSRMDRTEIAIVRNGKYSDLGKCKCQQFYRSLNKIREPTAVSRWESYGVQPQSWREVHEMPYKCTKSTRLQSLHFRIINRCIPTRKYLYTRVGSYWKSTMPEVFQNRWSRTFFLWMWRREVDLEWDNS